MDIQFTNNTLTYPTDNFALKTTNKKHIQAYSEKIDTIVGNMPEQDTHPSFGQMLFNAIHDVNNGLQTAHDMSIQAVTDPESVEAHDVSIALAKANLNLSITRNVIDRVVQAYRDIITLR